MIWFKPFSDIKILTLLTCLMLVGCGHIKTRKQISGTSPEKIQPAAESEEGAPEAPVGPEDIIVILGPGSVRALSHAGFLQALERNKVPIKSIAGIEWGAMVAGFYAVSGSSTKLQWELQKLNSKTLPSLGFISKRYETEDSKKFIKENISASILKSRVERSGIPFSCPIVDVFSFRQKTVSRGSLEDVLGACMAFPPLLKSKNEMVANLFSLNSVIEPLLNEEVKAIVYVNVLHSGGLFRSQEMQNNPSEALLWNEARRRHAKQLKALTAKYPKLVVVNVKNNSQPLFMNKNSNMLFLSGKRAGESLVNQLDL